MRSLWYMMICILSFSSLKGWTARYNGPGNGDDVATAIAVDANGNVYVTGYSHGGSSTRFDYATIKYGPQGNQLWVKRYNGPGNGDDVATAIEVDANGYVYVTGYSDGGSSTYYDYATIKYDPQGNQLWVKRYNGPVNGNDYARAITVDASGNVYVTGESVDIPTDEDYTTIKYDPQGNELWVKRYNGPVNGTDVARAIAVDANGYVYVTGSSEGSGTAIDYVTIRYNPQGTALWLRRYNGTGNGGDYAWALAIDAVNVYVTGQSVGTGTSADYATIKYSIGGTQLWEKRYNGTGNGMDVARAIAVDANGNVYVTGKIEVSTASYDYATVKYSAEGTQLWERTYNGPGNDDDEATAIAVDASGNVYVTGLSEGLGTSSDYATIKYNTGGAQLWERRYNGPANQHDYAEAITVDANYVYVTGRSTGSGTGYDYLTIKYQAISVEEDFSKDNQAIIIFPELLHSPTFFKDNILIKLKRFSKEPMKIIIFNSIGKIVYFKNYPFTYSVFLSDEKLKKLGKGVYFLSVYSGKKSFGKIKLIKE